MDLWEKKDGGVMFFFLFFVKHSLQHHETSAGHHRGNGQVPHRLIPGTSSQDQPGWGQRRPPVSRLRPRLEKPGMT